LNPVWECGILSTFAGTVPQKSEWVVTIVLTGVKTALASHVSSCVDESYNNCKEEEEGDKHDLESVASFAEACVPYKTVKYCFTCTVFEGVKKEHFGLGIGMVWPEM